MPNSPVPVRPSYPQRGPRHLERAAWAAVVASLGGPSERDPVAVARRLYGDDPVPAAILLRAVMTGARTDVAGWISELAGHALADFMGGLGPGSAMAEVIRRGVVVPIGENVEVKIPYRSPTAAGAWVGEGLPIPLAQMPLSIATLGPKKAGVLVTFTRELAQYGGAEAVFAQMLREAAGATIDSLYLGTAAATTDSLAGLLYGVSALTSAGSALADLEQLAAAVSGTDGSGEVVYIASPGLAASLRVSTAYSATVLPSAAVPTTRLIALDPAGIIHGISPAPDITASIEATLHMESVPLQLATGAPGAGVLATPTQSMFQTAQIAMRMIVDLAYTKRRSNAVAYVDPIGWSG